MIRLHYCSVRLVRHNWVLEYWSANAKHRITKLNCDPRAKIAQLGLDGWEVLIFGIDRRTESSTSESYPYYLLKREPHMIKWEYCSVHWQILKEFEKATGSLSKKDVSVIKSWGEKYVLVAVYWAADGNHRMEGFDLPDVHAVAAKLAQEGWEVVHWQPPAQPGRVFGIPGTDVSKISGGVLLKRCLSI